MPATSEAGARTRAFARVIGPYLVIVPAIIAMRAPNTGTILTAFFENEALVWLTGGLLWFVGLLIIAHHQYWSSLSAVLISLFGWFLALRGLTPTSPAARVTIHPPLSVAHRCARHACGPCDG
jgi:hypothetical protein